jgi:hypothetical protein
MRLIWRRRIVALLVVMVAAGSVEAATATGAEVRPAKQAAARVAERARTTTVVQAAGQDERSAPVTVMLVGVGAVVGVVVGILPALVAATLLGYLPPPRRRRRVGDMLVEPPGAPRLGAGGQSTMAPGAASGPVTLAVAEHPRSPEPPPAQLAILAHARHQAVYDAAYAEQLERVDELRVAIGDRLRKRAGPPTE